MVNHSKRMRKHAAMPVALGYGALISMGMILLGTAIMAQMIDREIMGADKKDYGIMILLIAATYLGSKTAYTRFGEKRFLISVLSGLTVFCLLLGITAVFFGGQFKGIGPNMILILCGCGLAALPRKEGRSTGRKRKIKIKTR